MIGFGTVFVAASIALTLVIQGFYKKTPLSERYLLVDEVLGGLLGVLQGVILLGAMMIILDSEFEVPGLTNRNELVLLRSLHEAYDPSATAAIMRSTIIPAFYVVVALFIPESLRNLHRGGSPA